MKKFRKNTLLELVGTNNEGDYLVQNEGDSSDRWIIPKATFENTYDEISNLMNFGQALEHLKAGRKVAREGWNGKNMFVYYVPGGSYKTQTDVAKEFFGEVAQYNPYLAIRTVNGSVSTWVPSINDCLAEDWEIVG